MFFWNYFLFWRFGKFHIFNIFANNLFMFNNFNFFSLWINFGNLLKNLFSLFIYKCVFINIVSNFFNWFHLYLISFDVVILTNFNFNCFKIWKSFHFDNWHAFLNESFDCLYIFSLFTPWTVWDLFFVSQSNDDMNNYCWFSTNIYQFIFRSIFINGYWYSLKWGSIGS